MIWGREQKLIIFCRFFKVPTFHYTTCCDWLHGVHAAPKDYFVVELLFADSFSQMDRKKCSIVMYWTEKCHACNEKMFHCHEWNKKVFHCHVWNKKVFHCHAWNKKVFHSHVWTEKVFHGPVWTVTMFHSIEVSQFTNSLISSRISDRKDFQSCLKYYWNIFQY
jgi:hypothetical protein